jgi:glucosylceramidase
MRAARFSAHWRKLTGSLQNGAFQRPDGRKVLLVRNGSGNARHFNTCFRGKAVTTVLGGGAVGTFVW